MTASAEALNRLTSTIVQAGVRVHRALGPGLLESAYLVQRSTQLSNEAGLAIISGEIPNPPKSTIFGRNNVRMNFLSPEALQEAEAIASPSKPEYNTWHEQLNKIAGFNVYEKMLPVARMYPADKLAIDVEPRRWWKSA